MIRSIITMFIPSAITDLSGAAAALAAFDEAPAPSVLTLPVDTAEMPFACSAEAGLMVG